MMEINLRAKVKFNEWTLQRFEFLYLRNQLNDEKLYKGDPRLLMYIAQTEGSSQTNIAKHLCIKPATLTVMIKRMESAGLIRRQQDEFDMRTLRVYITEEGRKTAIRTKEVFKQTVQLLYEGLSDSELEEYLRIMDKIQKNLVKLMDHIPEEALEFELPH